MSRKHLSLAWLLSAIVAVQTVTASRELEDVSDCDVVIVGGSTSGLAAAVTAAKEGAVTCLLEPTDMPGGQMTANGIPALDFSYENGCKPFNVSGAAPDTLGVLAFPSLNLPPSRILTLTLAPNLDATAGEYAKGFRGATQNTTTARLSNLLGEPVLLSPDCTCQGRSRYADQVSRTKAKDLL